MKTPEELAEIYISNLAIYQSECSLARSCFLAGYQAAKDQYKDAIDTYNDVTKQMLDEAVRIMTPTHEIAEEVLNNNPLLKELKDEQNT